MAAAAVVVVTATSGMTLRHHIACMAPARKTGMRRAICTYARTHAIFSLSVPKVTHPAFAWLSTIIMVTVDLTFGILLICHVMILFSPSIVSDVTFATISCIP